MKTSRANLRIDSFSKLLKTKRTLINNQNIRCGEYANLERGAAREAREAREAGRVRRQVPQDQTGVRYTLEIN